MADIKFYQVSKEIGGKQYMAQFNGISAYLRLTDSCRMDGGATLSGEKLANAVLKDVIVEPKGLTPDDFDCFDALNEVVLWGRDVAEGNFRGQAKQGAAG